MLGDAGGPCGARSRSCRRGHARSTRSPEARRRRARRRLCAKRSRAGLGRTCAEAVRAVRAWSPSVDATLGGSLRRASESLEIGRATGRLSQGHEAIEGSGVARGGEAGAPVREARGRCLRGERAFAPCSARGCLLREQERLLAREAGAGTLQFRSCSMIARLCSSFLCASYRALPRRDSGSPCLLALMFRGAPGGERWSSMHPYPADNSEESSICSAPAPRQRGFRSGSKYTCWRRCARSKCEMQCLQRTCK